MLSRYPGKPLVILGKGASVDDIDAHCLDDVFVIGLNDAELLGSADLTVLHEAWVLERLPQPSAPLYLLTASLPRLANFEHQEVFYADYEPLTQSNSELMFQRVFSDSMAIEEVMFLTALRIAHFAWSRGKCSSVFLVGFDFSMEAGFGKKFLAAGSSHSPATQREKIEMQERVFLTARDLMRQAGVEVFHVGYRQFSDMTPGAFSERMLDPLPAAGTTSRPKGGVLVTAEITTNHLGDLGLAKSMMRLAHSAGANFVKFQMRDVESFYSSDVLDGAYPSSFGNTFRQYRNALELSNESFSELAELAKDLGVGWFLSVLDEISLNRAVDLGATMIKIPGTMSRKRDFIRTVVDKFDGDLVFSTGMTSAKYVDWLLGLVGQTRRVYLLHANSAYPTPTEDCNVSVVSSYSRLAEEFPNVTPGYSSHDEGWFGSVLAVASGAKMIEKHVKLGASQAVHFDSVALNLDTNEFKDYVEHIRKAEIALGDGKKRITPSEHHKY